MHDENWTWTGVPPAEAGWYPVLVCWDPQEGIFPDAIYCDGHQWARDRAPISAKGKAEPFTSENEARDWAYAHDPEL